jgi:hypothetical protein
MAHNLTSYLQKYGSGLKNPSIKIYIHLELQLEIEVLQL